MAVSISLSLSLSVAGESCTMGNVDRRLPGKGISNSHGARPVHQIVSMIRWIRTSRLSINQSLSLYHGDVASLDVGEGDAQGVEDGERFTLVNSEHSAFQRKELKVDAPPGLGFRFRI